MQGLSCQCCHGISNQFTILKCDHVVCAQCLWGELTTALNGQNSIRCSCGQITLFQNKQTMVASSKFTAHTSPRLKTKQFKTQTATVSVRSPSTPRRQRLSKASQERSKSSNVNLRNQLDFLNIQFNKSMQQIQRNFNVVLQSIKQKYSNLLNNIKLFWLEEIVQSQPLTLLELPKLLMKKYNRYVGGRIEEINCMFLQQLSKFRIEGEERLETKVKSGVYKENRSQNCMEERLRLFRTLEELREEGKAIRKVGRKGHKCKFI